MKRSYFCLFIFLLSAGPGFAQSSEVEVNLDVLKSYDPPPMFDEAPLTTPGQPQAAPSGLLPLPEPSSQKAPVPKRKPFYDGQKAMAAPKSAPGGPLKINPDPLNKKETPPDETLMQVVEPVAPAKTNKKPPIPPRRPKTFHASESFIEKVRAEHGDRLQQSIVTAPGNNTATDTFERQLESPDARDVLASIDPEADLPPPPPAKPVKIKPEPLKPATPKPETVEEEPIDITAPAPEPVKFDGNDVISLGYLPGVTELPENIKQALAMQAFKVLNNKPDSRIEVQSYASNTDQGQSSARRISLARALEIRDFLVGKSVDPGRIDVRALGHETDEDPVDRVDIILISP